MKEKIASILRNMLIFAKKLAMSVEEKKIDRDKLVAYIMAAISVGLIIAGFLVPPLGVIDGSVLTGAGIGVFIMLILFAWHAVDKGIDAKLVHGDTSIELNNPDPQK